MHILTLCRLTTLKVYDHLLPLLMNEGVEQMTLARYASLPRPLPKLTQLAFADDSAGGSDGLPILRRLKNQWDLFWLALQTARREQPQVIYGIFFTTNGVMAWIIGRLLGKKVMITCIGTDLNKHIFEYRLGFPLRWIARHSDVVTVFDEASRQRLIGLGVAAECVYTIPHGIAMERFPIAEQTKTIEAVYTGMLVDLKELQRLIAAWRLVVDRLPQAQLVLVGDGVLRADLEAQTRSLGLQGNITFTGWVDTVADYLAQAKIFCNVANQEGVPHSMLEAMAVGLVPVMTSVGGVPSVIQDGVNGFLVANPAEPAQVAQQILCLLQDDSLYQTMRQAALAVRHTYTYAQVSQTWTPVLAALQGH
jgi:glycosyltransferase involved in cell wall biosynthesis